MLGCCAEHDRSGVTATYRTTTPKSGCGRVGVPWTALDGTRRSPAYAGRVPPSSIAEPGGPVPGMAMGEDARKLTVYFGERSQVAPGRFAADALLDLFGSHRIAASVLLRGIEGFGLRHTLRSDRSLSLSEDPPVVAVAVDTTGRIDDLTHDVEALNLRGLVTLERARLIRDVPETPNVPPDPPESVKVTVYVGRQDRTGRLPTYMAVCDLLHRGGLADASVFLGVDGTANGARQRARFFDRNADVPIMIIAVGDGDRVGPVIPELGALLPHPMLTLERIRVCKRDGVLLAPPHELPRSDPNGLALWQKIMVYTSESTLHRGAPIHRALVRGLRSTGPVRGATAIRGIWGFHGEYAPHGDRLLQVRRSVPVGTIVVDEPGRVAESFRLIDEVTAEHGLVTSEMVPALVSVQPGGRHGGFWLAERAN